MFYISKLVVVEFGRYSDAIFFISGIANKHMAYKTIITFKQNLSVVKLLKPTSIDISRILHPLISRQFNASSADTQTNNQTFVLVWTSTDYQMRLGMWANTISIFCVYRECLPLSFKETIYLLTILLNKNIIYYKILPLLEF